MPYKVIIVCMSIREVRGDEVEANYGLDNGRFNLRVTIEPMPEERQIEFSGDVSLVDENKQINMETGTVRIIPEAVAEVQDAIRANIPMAGADLGNLITAIEYSTGESLPDNPIGGIDWPGTIKFNTERVGSGGALGGDPNYSDGFRKVFPMPPMTVPVPSFADFSQEEFLQNVPPLEFRVKFSEDREGLVGSAVSYVVSPHSVEFTMSVPPEMFIQFVEISECENIYPDIDSELSSAEQRADSYQNTLMSRISKLNEIVSDLETTLGVSIPPLNITSDYFNLDEEDVRDFANNNMITDGGTESLIKIQAGDVTSGSGVSSEVRDIMERLDNLPGGPTSPSITTILSDASGLESQVSNLPSNECKQNYQERARELNERARALSRTVTAYQSEKENISDELRGALSNAEALQDIDAAAFVSKLPCVNSSYMKEQGWASQIQDIRDTFQNLIDGDITQEDLSEIKDLRGSLQTIITEMEADDNINTGNPGGDCLSKLRDLSSRMESTDIGQNVVECAEAISDSTEQNIQNFKDNVESFSTDTPLSELKSARAEGRDIINNQLVNEDVRQECITQFQNELENDYMPTLSTLISDVEGSQAVDCIQEAPQRVRSSVSSYETDVNSLSSSSPISRFNSLESEASSIKSMINSANIPNECQIELENRVESALGRLDRLREEKQRFEEIEGPDCAEDYPNIESRVEKFSGDVAFASGDEIGPLITEGRDIIETISSEVDSKKCAEEFVNTVRASIDTLQERNVRVRVSTGEIPQQEQGRQERIAGLQEALNQFIGEDFSGELPEIPGEGGSGEGN